MHGLFFYFAKTKASTGGIASKTARPNSALCSLHMCCYAHMEICIGSITVGVCGERGRGTISVSALSQLHTEPRYNYPNKPSIHTEHTWLAPPPATGLTTRGNLTAIQPVDSTTFTKEEETQRLVLNVGYYIKKSLS